MLSFRKFILENWFEENDNTHLRRRSTIQDQLGKSKISKEESGAVKRYIKDSKPIHKQLKAGKTDNPDIQHLDNYIKKNKIPIDLHTYSALTYNPKNRINHKNELHLPGYMSVTPHKDVAKDYSTKSDDGIHHIAHIILKKEDSAASLGTHEDEILIGRGHTYQYHGHEDVEDGPKKYRIHKMSII